MRATVGCVIEDGYVYSQSCSRECIIAVSKLNYTGSRESFSEIFGSAVLRPATAVADT